MVASKENSGSKSLQYSIEVVKEAVNKSADKLLIDESGNILFKKDDGNWDVLKKPEENSDIGRALNHLMYLLRKNDDHQMKFDFEVDLN